MLHFPSPHLLLLVATNNKGQKFSAKWILIHFSCPVVGKNTRISNFFFFFFPPVRQAWMVVRSDGCFISLSKLTVPFAGFLLQLVFKGSDT